MFQPIGNRALRCEACKQRQCEGCGKQFTNKHAGNNTRYCSNKCYLSQRWEGHGIVTANCVVCGAPFEKATYRPKQTCSPSCRVRKGWADNAARDRRIQSLKASPSMRSPARKEQLDRARAKIKFGPEMREKLRKARMRQHFPTKMTSIERALHDEFKKRRLPFEMHKVMFDRFQPDFAFEAARLIVQADGTYWHSLPKNILRDSLFDELALKDGWTVWRFTEKAIKENPAACGRAVARFLREIANAG